jgi:hypothetical protein
MAWLCLRRKTAFVLNSTTANSFFRNYVYRKFRGRPGVRDRRNVLNLKEVTLSKKNFIK